MNERPWFREPMLALVIGIPLATVAAGIATLVIAARGPGDAMDDGVRRVAQAQIVDLAPDREAARLGLGATATIDAAGTVELRFRTGTPPAAQTLVLTLRHSTDPQLDRVVTLNRDSVRYAGRLTAARAPGAYNAMLGPADGSWRLVGRLALNGDRLDLGPSLVN